MTGTVYKSTGSWYQVKTLDGKMFECKIKGNLRIQDIRSTNPIAVGDIVEFELLPEGIALIHSIHNRRNYIIRRSSNLSKESHILAANLNLVVLVVTINYPKTSHVFIDRFLATAEAYQVPACLVFNKIDIYSEKELYVLDQFVNLYQSINYPVFKVSSTEGIGIKQLSQFLENKTTLFSGNSGVGKSTLINAITSEVITKTGAISTYHNKGKHTTTFSEMFELKDGGYIIDTPGIKGFGTIDMNEAEVSHYFREIFQSSKKCRFSNCTHTHEPGCSVIESLNSNTISLSRYQSYLSILQDCKNGKYR